MNRTISLGSFSVSLKALLIVVVLLGAFLRIINVNSNPRALYGDELTLVYDTYSVLNTGYDQVGEKHPLTFAMGAGRPGGYIYFSLPFVAVFGPTALGVRGLSIFSGIAIILLMFLLGREFYSEDAGLVAAFLTAVSPWDIALSRGGFEAHFALFLSLLGVLLFVKAAPKPFFYVLSAVCFGLTVHTYPTFKLTLPLFLIALVWWAGGIKKLLTTRVKWYVFVSIGILVVFGILAIYQTFSAGSESRFGSLNLLGQDNLQQLLVQDINQNRNIEDYSIFSEVFHNKFIDNSLILGESYLKNFSLDFLFFHGDRDPRHNPATMGELYIAQLVLLGFGVWFVLSRREYRKLFYLLFFWILITPLATAFLLDPHALRNDFMLPPLTLLCSIGLAYLFMYLKRTWSKTVVCILGFLFLVQFVFMIERVYFLSPDLFSNFWSYPAKQASEYAFSQRDNYDFVIVSSRIDNVEFAYPVYEKIDPYLVIAQNQNPVILDGFKFKKFDNVYIGSLPDGETQQFLNGLKGKVLYLGSSFETANLTSYKVVGEKDGTIGYIIEK